MKNTSVLLSLKELETLLAFLPTSKPLYKKLRALADKFPKVEAPMCEECDVEMHRYAVGNVEGWSCDLCGWSWDDD